MKLKSLSYGNKALDLHLEFEGKNVTTRTIKNIIGTVNTLLARFIPQSSTANFLHLTMIHVEHFCIILKLVGQLDYGRWPQRTVGTLMDNTAAGEQTWA